MVTQEIATVLERIPSECKVNITQHAFGAEGGSKTTLHQETNTYTPDLMQHVSPEHHRF